MQLDYLTLEDKNEYLRLTDCLVESEVNDDVWRAFFQTYEESDMRAIYMVRVTDKGETKTVGTVTTIVEPKIYLPGPVVHIEDLIVFPKYRNLGIGKMIVKEVEKLAASYNASIMCAACGNEDLLGFFMNCFVEKDKPVLRDEAAFGFTLSKWL